jgi:hypothetical protein
VRPTHIRWTDSRAGRTIHDAFCDALWPVGQIYKRGGSESINNGLYKNYKAATAFQGILLPLFIL